MATVYLKAKTKDEAMAEASQKFGVDKADVGE